MSERGRETRDEFDLFLFFLSCDLISPPNDDSWRQEVDEITIALLLNQRWASFNAMDPLQIIQSRMP
jgi:hypothetical protein